MGTKGRKNVKKPKQNKGKKGKKKQGVLEGRSPFKLPAMNGSGGG